MATGTAPSANNKPGIALQLLSIGIGLLIFFICACMAQIADNQHLRQQRERVSNVTHSIRNSMQSSLSSVVFLNQGLASIVATRPDIARLEIESLAEELLGKSKLLDKAALLKQGSSAIVWPPVVLRGNTALEMTDITLIAEQLSAEKNTLIIPDSLGDKSYLLVYSPVFLSAEQTMKNDQPPFWGMVALFVDQESFFWQTGLINENHTNSYALRIRNSDGSHSPLFGDQVLFSSNAITTEIRLPFTTWELAARPTQGWSHAEYILWIVLGGAILALAAGSLAWLILNYQRTIHHMAMHDTLTGLPNRILVADRAQQALAKARRYNHKVAILHIDLDNFKPINDRHGHKTGDRLLVEIANRLTDCTRATDTTARVGGDEFVLIIPEIASPHSAELTAAKIIRCLNQPIQLTPSLAISSIGVSIGIAIYPDHSHDFNTLVRLADTAMYQAKNSGKNHYRLAPPAQEGHSFASGPRTLPPTPDMAS